MNKFKDILICTDLDGTLLRSDRSLARENVEAIEYFKSEGGRFTFITGRMYFFVKEMYDMVKPNAPVGTINGGALYDFEKEKYTFLQKLTLPNQKCICGNGSILQTATSRGQI